MKTKGLQATPVGAQDIRQEIPITLIFARPTLPEAIAVALDHTRRDDIYLLICLAPQVLNDQVVRRLEPNCTIGGCQAEFAPSSVQLHKPIQAVRDGQAGYVHSRLVHKYHIVFVFAPVNSGVSGGYLILA